MDQQQRADLYEPSPRFTHVAASVSDVSTSQLVIVWGGQTAESYSRDGRTQLPSCCQLFHIQSEVWSERHAVLGPPHPGLSTAACTSFEDYLFIYGGFVYNDSGLLVFSGELSCLNIKTLTWSQLCPAGTAGGPMRKASCGMVLVDSDKLAVIGGYGFPTGPTQPGSSFIIDTKFTDGRGWTSEVHVFDLSQGSHGQVHWMCTHWCIISCRCLVLPSHQRV